MKRWAGSVATSSLFLSAIGVLPDMTAHGHAMIAATALVHGPIVVTRNTADFSAAAVELIDPWIGQRGRTRPGKWNS